MKAYIVVGLGFGDEGKGTIVDYLSYKHRPEYIVKFTHNNITHHNIYLDNGTWFPFFYFGSGTFHDAKTYLSNYTVIDPMALEREALALENRFIKNALSLIYADEDALVITPYHRNWELKENPENYGNGTREAILDHNNGVSLFVGDLLKKDVLEEKLSLLRYEAIRKFEESQFMSASDIYLDVNNRVLANIYREIAKKINIVDSSFYEEIHSAENVIFEGTQGILRDKKFGLTPNMLDNTTNENALEILDGYTGEIETIGVSRTYMIKQGFGPFPTRDDPNNSELLIQIDNNKPGYNLGHLDMMLLDYSLRVADIDSIALTFLGNEVVYPKVCIKYEEMDEIPVDIDIETLYDVTPVYENMTKREIILNLTKNYKPVKILSFGRRTTQKAESTTKNEYINTFGEFKDFWICG